MDQTKSCNGNCGALLYESRVRLVFRLKLIPNKQKTNT